MSCIFTIQKIFFIHVCFPQMRDYQHLVYVMDKKTRPPVTAQKHHNIMNNITRFWKALRLYCFFLRKQISLSFSTFYPKMKIPRHFLNFLPNIYGATGVHTNNMRILSNSISPTYSHINFYIFLSFVNCV